MQILGVIFMFYFKVADCCTDLLCVSYCLVLLYIVSFQQLLGCI